ncbi:hypothetical protein [Enterococcus faecium]|uniref:hypothetical protein n=1 Tax=Enterococcus faecium TaxID=1352 RepID=UPI002201262D|nr:hypothetical protein [Enterococcus faecium]BDP46009.1 hypothetical protein EfmJHP9_08790 [Enterococcus faecium]
MEGVTIYLCGKYNNSCHIIFYCCVKTKWNKKDLKNYILAIVSSIGSVLILFALFNATKILFQELLPHLKEINFVASKIAKGLIDSGHEVFFVSYLESEKPQVESKYYDLYEKKIFLSIWKSAWEIFKTSWLIGVSPKNVVSYAQSIIPDGYIAKVGIAIHNAYLNASVLFSEFLKYEFPTVKLITWMHSDPDFIYNKCIGKDYHFVYCLVILSYALYAALNNELVYENTVGTHIKVIYNPLTLSGSSLISNLDKKIISFTARYDINIKGFDYLCEVARRSRII